MSNIKEILLFFIRNLLPYLAVFLFSLYLPADADLGWHLKYGEYFVRTGHVLRENILSLEMSDYAWVNSSWGTDILSFLFYNWKGFLGISIAGALSVTLILFVLNKALKASFWEKTFIIALFLLTEQPLILVSFRGQLISLLFISILYLLIRRFFGGNKKIIYLAVPLFFLWVNLHGGFLLGLVLFALFIFLNFVKDLIFDKKFLIKEKVNLLLSLFLSFLATLFNPFGFAVYLESFKHFGNPYQKYIIEWLPLDPFSTLWWTLIFWGIFLIIILRSIANDKETLKKNFEIIILTLLFYFLGHWMRRYVWTMYLVSMPLVYYFFHSIKPRNLFLKRTISLLIIGGFYIYSVFYKLPQVRLAQMDWERYCREVLSCSIKSAEFLKQNPEKGKFLSFYDWGGFLIWNYPEIVPSIDGRMHLWRNEKNYSAFGNYYFLEQNVNDIEKSGYEVVYMSRKKPLFDRLIILTREGKWKIVYLDEYSGIFKRV